MPERADRMMLLLGIGMHIVAMTGIFGLGPTNKTNSMIDFFHWLILFGAVFQLPFAVNLRQSPLAIGAGIVLVLGLVSTIGMCVLDFVFWALPDPSMSQAVADELVTTPSIWPVFMGYGPEEVQYVGYLLAAFTFRKMSLPGTALILLGAVLTIAGPSWFNVAGTGFVLAGFMLIFAKARSATSESCVPA